MLIMLNPKCPRRRTLNGRSSSTPPTSYFAWTSVAAIAYLLGWFFQPVFSSTSYSPRGADEADAGGVLEGDAARHHVGHGAHPVGGPVPRLGRLDALLKVAHLLEQPAAHRDDRRVAGA